LAIGRYCQSLVNAGKERAQGLEQPEFDLNLAVSSFTKELFMKSAKYTVAASFIAASALALGLSVGASAQTTPTPGAGPGQHEHHHEGRGGHGMKRMDKDGDKALSRDEVKGHPHLEKDFDSIDTNKDGKLSPDEMKAFGQKMREQHKADGKGPNHGSPMSRLDANKDGKVSREEAKGHPMLEKNFDRIDANKDGLLTEEEIKAARKTEMEARMKNRAEGSK
jgi:Ca2+-binding EF-hand superfamily protein